jgi:uncharacterized iron-regulated protein
MLSFFSCASHPEYYLSLRDSAPVNFHEILRRIENNRVIFVGEGHTSKRDHLLQFEVIKHLRKGGSEVAVAMEMFPHDEQNILNSWIEDSIPENVLVKVYERHWLIPYSHYSDIFDYAKETGIPLIGINADMAMIRTVARKGIQVIPSKLLEKLKFTPCSEDSEYEEWIGFSEKRIRHGEALPYFCNAQRLRDATMAYNIAKIIRSDRFTVIVLVGAVHAAKVAVPRMLNEHVAIDSTVLMPRSFGYIIDRRPDIHVADFIWY